MSHPLTHAGGVVYRETDEGLQFLLVRARWPPFDWVLPKGHIEPEEQPEQTARREVQEEAGVDAAVGDPVGDVTFEARGRLVHARYFAMRYLGAVPPQEARDTRWCPLAECEQLLTFESARALVRRAAALAA